MFAQVADLACKIAKKMQRLDNVTHVSLHLAEQKQV